MKAVFLLCICVAVVCGKDEDNFDPIESKHPLESKNIIHQINNVIKPTWTAAFYNSLPKNRKNLLGVLQDKPSSIPVRTSLMLDISRNPIKLPKNFDARLFWPQCNSLQEVRDQGDCGSCWAVSSASTFTDRFCIATNGSWNGHLSAEDLMTCCYGPDACGYGCGGGYVDLAWNHLQDVGIVTGGDYRSKEGCLPYRMRACEHHVSGTRVACSDLGPDTVTPPCIKRCITRSIKYKNDLRKVSSVYSLNNIEQIQQDIYTNGPILATFDVYEDFFNYKSGVYQNVLGDLVGAHAAKVIGWGNENGTDYWLAANSWNTDWGEHGFFKILRGNNECSFESSMYGGIPDIESP